MNHHWILNRLMCYDTVAFLLCIFFFLIWPQFDLYVSQLFFDSNGGGFFLKNHIITKFIYSLTDLIGAALIISLAIMIAASWLVKKDFLIQRRRIMIFLLSAFILGPGLIVNVTLKDNWDRPRPRQIIEFGGDKKFEPPFQPRFKCPDCHSFVSGHASVGFYFFAFALLAKKRKWLWLPVIAGTVIGTGRIAQGGHFLSDVIFSGWVVWFCSLLLYTWFFREKYKNT